MLLSPVAKLSQNFWVCTGYWFANKKIKSCTYYIIQLKAQTWRISGTRCSVYPVSRKGKWGSTMEEGPGAGMLNRILGGKVRDETESSGNWRKCGRKRKYGNVERGTSKATMVDEEIERRAKAHKRWDSWLLEAVGRIPAQRCSLTLHYEPAIRALSKNLGSPNTQHFHPSD